MISDNRIDETSFNNELPQLKMYKFSLAEERRRDGRNCKDPNYIVSTTKMPSPESPEAGQKIGSTKLDQTCLKRPKLLL